MMKIYFNRSFLSKHRLSVLFRSRVVKFLLWLSLVGLSGLLVLLAGFFLYLDPQIPSAESYRNYHHEMPLRIFAADGALLAEFGNRRLIPIRLEEAPEIYIKGLVATEDKRFYDHGGIDWLSLGNDFIDLLTNPDVRRGASTITMQLPRNVADLSREQTFIRKFKEMLLALQIERTLTKDEILELYINVVPFGKHAYGVQAAAYTYYGKPVSELSVAQLAMLVGISKRPEAGNPINGPEWALNRRNLVLRRMRGSDVIDNDTYEREVRKPIAAQVHRRELDLHAPYPAEWVRREVFSLFGDEIYTGWSVHTTIHTDLQATAQQALKEGLHTYDNRYGYRGVEKHLVVETEADPIQLGKMASRFSPVGFLLPAVVSRVSERSIEMVDAESQIRSISWDGLEWARRFRGTNVYSPPPERASDIVKVGDLVRIREIDGAWRLSQIPDVQGALVSIRPRTGAILAMVGGYNFSVNQFNHVTQARRQPGSGFKPFVYSAAIAAGRSPASIYLDAPIVFDDPSLERPYRPQNDGGRFNGPTRMREALYRSINLVSIRVMNDVGVKGVRGHAQKFGFDVGMLPRTAQLAIGGGKMAVSPLEMAKAYAVFANRGFEVAPHLISRVETRQGDTVYQPGYSVACDPCNDVDLHAPQDQSSPYLTSETDVAITNGTGSDSQSLNSSPTIVPATRVVDERNVFIVDSMLKDVIKHGTGRKANLLGRNDIAGKTGTTDLAVDTWFNGYNSENVTVVWVGFSDNRSLGQFESGSTRALSIWINYMKTALANVDEVLPKIPNGVVRVRINPETGATARPGQSNAIFEYFLAENAPDKTLGPNSSTVSQVVHPEDIF